MPRKPAEPFEPADGPILRENLIRLGFFEKIVHATKIAKLVTEKTGKSMSRQRISNLFNAVHITPDTIATIAKGLGVKPEELMRRPKR